MAQWVKNLSANAGDTGDACSICGSGRSFGERSGNSLQCSCLENPMDREAWWATVQRVTKSQTQLSMHAYCIVNLITSETDELEKILKGKNLLK